MPKRKADSDDESSEGEPIQKKQAKKPAKGKAAEKPVATIKKPKFEKPVESSDSEDSASDASEADAPGPKVLKSAEGESYIDLGKKKRATVRSFKGMALLDIREFWGNEGDEKPGKKGISLTMDQWKSLKAAVDTLDKLMAKQSKS